MLAGINDQSEIVKLSVVEEAVDYQLSSWWSIIERAGFLMARYNYERQGNGYIVVPNTEFLISKARNYTEDMLIHFIDKSFIDDKNNEIERERFERNTGLGILLDYWGGRGRSRLRQRDIAKKYGVTESYVSQVIRKAKMQLGAILDQALQKNLITKRQKEIFLACYKDNLSHYKAAKELGTSRSYVTYTIRLVKERIVKAIGKEVANNKKSRGEEVFFMY